MAAVVDIERLRESVGDHKPSGCRASVKTVMQSIEERTGQVCTDKYHGMSFKSLMSTYAFEVCRVNQEDKQVTQNLVRNELAARLQDTFRMLDENPESVEAIYQQFING